MSIVPPVNPLSDIDIRCFEGPQVNANISAVRMPAITASFATSRSRRFEGALKAENGIVLRIYLRSDASLRSDVSADSVRPMIYRLMLPVSLGPGVGKKCSKSAAEPTGNMTNPPG